MYYINFWGTKSKILLIYFVCFLIEYVSTHQKEEPYFGHWWAGS